MLRGLLTEAYGFHFSLRSKVSTSPCYTCTQDGRSQRKDIYASDSDVPSGRGAEHLNREPLFFVSAFTENDHSSPFADPLTPNLVDFDETCFR